jgi:hypothetical protein
MSLGSNGLQRAIPKKREKEEEGQDRDQEQGEELMCPPG